MYLCMELATDSLATQDKRRRRGLSPSSVCDICGNGPETRHHAVVSCTKAAALWKEMRKVWNLPDARQLQETGPDWLLLLLSTLNRVPKARVLLLMWRLWFLRNNMILGKGQETIMGSAHFLVSYSEFLDGLSTKGRQGGDDKGKAPIETTSKQNKRNMQAVKERNAVKWEPPQNGWAKLNIDVGFCINQGVASTGMVVRD
jgi:hypothetical protein